MSQAEKKIIALPTRAGIYPHYASDAAFTTARGVVEEGDRYWNTTLSQPREYTGGIFRPIGYNLNNQINKGYYNNSKIFIQNPTTYRLGGGMVGRKKGITIRDELMDLSSLFYDFSLASNDKSGNPIQPSTFYYLYGSNSRSIHGLNTIPDTVAPLDDEYHPTDPNVIVVGVMETDGSAQLTENTQVACYCPEDEFKLLGDPTPVNIPNTPTNQDYLVTRVTYMPGTKLHIHGNIYLTNNGSAEDTIVCTLLVNGVQADTTRRPCPLGLVQTLELDYTEVFANYGVAEITVRIIYKSALGNNVSTLTGNLSFVRERLYDPRQTFVKNRVNDCRLEKVTLTQIKATRNSFVGFTEVNNEFVDLDDPSLVLNTNTALLMSTGLAPTLPGDFEVYLRNSNNGAGNAPELGLDIVDHDINGDRNGDINDRHVGRVYLNASGEVEEEYHLIDYTKRHYKQLLPQVVTPGGSSTLWFEWITWLNIPLFKNGAFELVKTHTKTAHLTSTTNEASSGIEFLINGNRFMQTTASYYGFIGFAEKAGVDSHNISNDYLTGGTPELIDFRMESRRVANRGPLTMIQDSFVVWRHRAKGQS